MGNHDRQLVGYMQKTTCQLDEIVALAEKTYNEGKIPLICGQNEEKAQANATFWTYATACTVLECKPLVGLAMNEGKAACWERVKTAAAGAMKAGNTLVLHMRDGCADLNGFAADAGGKEAFDAIFTADIPKQHTSFPGLDLEVGDVRDEFKVCVVSSFIEEDIEDFFAWGPIPMEMCHLLVIAA